MRSAPWIVAGFQFFLAAAGCAASAPRNVLLILTEDQGAHASAYRTPGLATPRIDSLARRGVLFRNAFVAYPLCSPSKASLLTGLYAHTHGIRGNTMNYFKPMDEMSEKERRLSQYGGLRDARIPTLVELLHHAGYYTGITNKLHVKPNDKFPFDAWIARPDRSKALEFFAQAARAAQPWFLLYNTHPVHRPFRNSEEVHIGVRSDRVVPPRYLPDTPAVRREWSEYLDRVQLADEMVGEVLAALRGSGQEDETLVIFTSDHGPAFYRGKMSPYDLGLRVPLIVEGPGVKRGRVSEALVSELDLTPTILDLLGLPALKRVHGQSLRPLLQGLDAAWARSYIVGEVDHRPYGGRGMQELSIYDGRYRLIYRENEDLPRWLPPGLREWKRWRNRSYREAIAQRARFPRAYEILSQVDPERLGGRPPRFELYETATDPDEVIDLAGDSHHREAFERLRVALRDWAVRTGDRFVTPERIAAPAPPAGD